MAPNPIMLPRKQPSNARNERLEQESTAVGTTWPLLATPLTLLLVLTTSWARRWLFSGCAVESLLILFDSTTKSRTFPAIPLWTLLSSFNLIYAVASTSWLLYALFSAACWPSVFLTCLLQFQLAADFARKNLRTLLRDLHFTRDRIALFNLPALEIDTEVAGLMVIRGITLSLSNLTLVAHGIEVGIKLTDEIELALHTDEVRVPLFRSIEVDDVYANIKGGKAEMTFADLEEDQLDEHNFFNETPLLRAATAGLEGTKDRPKLQENLVGGTYIKDSPATTLLDNIQTLSPDNQVAEKQYMDILTNIRTSSAIYQGRARARQTRKAASVTIEDEKEMRAAVCAELHHLPSVPHPPQRSVKVTTLQKLSTPGVRRFMHRLPFLLRLLIGPLGYFHPLTIASINAAGSGQWLKELLQAEVFKSYGDHSAEVRRLQRRISTWLADANFCLQMTDIDGLAQVPVTTNFDVVAYLHFADIMAYRALPQSGELKQVVRLGGADATFTIPVYLLPHHEHILPPRPTPVDEMQLKEEVKEADGIPKAVQAERELERLKKDETTINMSVHASLPATFDQSLLAFVAALVKATKIIELDREVEKLDPDKVAETPELLSHTPRSMSVTSVDTTDSIESLPRRVQTDITPTSKSNRFKAFTKNLQQNLRDASIQVTDTYSKENMREFVRDVQQQTRDGMKKTVVASMVNDRWIAKMVGKIAANLEKAQGDLGYTGAIPIPLEPYRPGPHGDGMLSKLLP
ncbi:hypothetical protein LTR70_002725 [Exophiala xenobiotica]|uniref:Uncharacterized protein n=1 Tax=Lithohypha guttulata TaxID=1690604 RepID=A0ABR0KJI7_9EURO|nr:hypothetical protein LTR24_001831 [Lithohypha guttulata]KAK5324651.1 hypothetical protein LTR70_002725 [Exophiala xenobiotica]